MQYLVCNYTKISLIIDLEYTFNWASCVLSRGDFTTVDCEAPAVYRVWGARKRVTFLLSDP